MRPLPPAPASISTRVARHLLSRSRTTVFKMLARGDLTRAADGHISTASIGALLGHPVTAQEFAVALTLRAGEKR